MSTQYTPNSNAIGVYLIRFTGSELVYIGSTSRGFRKRRYIHMYDLRVNRHINRHLQHAYNHYGLDAFEFVILEVVDDPSQVVCREDYWMDTYRATHKLYNVLPHAGSPRGMKFSPLTEAQKENLRVKLTGRKPTEEQRQRQRDGITPEVRARHSAATRGKKMPASMIEKQRVRMAKTHAGLASPDGVEYRDIVDLSAFCKDHGLRRKPMYDVASGNAISSQGWTLIGADRSKMRTTQVYSFVSPEGTRYDKIASMTVFCREHGLSRHAMYHIHVGECKQHKGWTKGD